MGGGPLPVSGVFARIGQILGFGIAVFIIWHAVKVAPESPGTAFSLVGVTLISLFSVFVWGRKSSEKNET